MKFRILISVFIVMALFGCRNDDDILSDPALAVARSFASKQELASASIGDWRRRELAGISVLENTSGYFDRRMAQNIVAYSEAIIEYNQVKLDSFDGSPLYFQTRAETETIRTGICNDIAIYEYIRMRELGFGDSKMAIVLFGGIGKIGHAAFVELETPWDVDSFRIVTRDDVLPVGQSPDGLLPYVGFNLFETWTY